MNQNEAFELARSLLRPTGALGYLVTRGPAWPPLAQCGEYKRVVGRVMGNAYCLLQPIWDEHPDLDPGSGSNTDPLKLQDQPHPRETRPAGLLQYLEEAHDALPRIVSRMLCDVSISRHKRFIEALAQELGEAITHAKQVLEHHDIYLT
jgi:hypothetical protein